MNRAEQRFANFFNAYAKGFNKSYNRTGKLFEERFKKKKVGTNRYYTQMIYYIHANAQRHGSPLISAIIPTPPIMVFCQASQQIFCVKRFWIGLAVGSNLKHFILSCTENCLIWRTLLLKTTKTAHFKPRRF